MMIENSKKKRLNSGAIGFSPSLPIFVDEHLTKETRDLLHNAKELQNQGKLTAVWCIDGKVKIR
jgi:hypothetical protein